MAVFRFVHTSDLHLGRRFSNFPEAIRGRLVEARHGVLRRLVRAARECGARHILVAGDLFDTETPSAEVWRQALAEMRSAEDMSWIVIPGNHDSQTAESLWTRIADKGGIQLVTEAGPLELAPGVTLLPSPVPSRAPGRDLTEWMSSAGTPEGHIRIGLAHGGVTAFGDGMAETIPPDRARTARLDYLALGDWHGCLRITDRTWYSGTPERDRFKHSGRGACLAVTVPGPGMVPEVREVETGLFDWAEVPLVLTPGGDVRQALHAAVHTGGESRRDMLRRVRASGWVRLPERSDLERAADEVAPEFGYFELVSTELGTECAADDLDEISKGGVLRLAAEELYAAAEDGALSAEERRLAAGALRRLYGYVAHS